MIYFLITENDDGSVNLYMDKVDYKVLLLKSVSMEELEAFKDRFSTSVEYYIESHKPKGLLN